MYDQAEIILRIAKDMDMTGFGWSWVLSDGFINQVIAHASESPPGHMTGIIGPGFASDSGSLSPQFLSGRTWKDKADTWNPVLLSS